MNKCTDTSLHHAGIHARFGGVGLSFQVTKGPINITFGEELPREYPLYKITTECSQSNEKTKRRTKQNCIYAYGRCI